ncbi:MAG: uracil-DNA glycosylase [Fuerstiella sp.]
MAESNRTWKQYLQMLQRSGISFVPKVSLPSPAARTTLRRRDNRSQSENAAGKSQAEGAAVRPSTRPAKSLNAGVIEVPARLPETDAILTGSLETSEDKSTALNQMAQLVSACRRCTELADSRRQTVFGVGNPNADIMFIGEAPGADEDRQGEPFVGAAGQLLNRIIAACELKREDLYICNILRCRPPGNRNPRPQEAANCREFLDAQVRIVDPDYIICWGTVAAQNLLQETRSVGQLRGSFLKHGRADVLCTYHPSYLLRNPAAKKQVWADMQLFLKHRNGSIGDRL